MSAPRRILHVAPRFLPIGPDAVVGGSNNGLWNLAVGLRERHPDAQQVLVTATNEEGVRWMAALAPTFDEVVWRRLPHDLGPLAYGLRVVTELAGALVTTARRVRPDVVHGHSGYPHYAALTAAAARAAGASAVHSLYCPLEAAVHDRRRLVAHPAVGRAVLAGVDHVLPMSANVDASLARAGIAAARRTVVAPGLRASLTAGLPTRAECRRQVGVGEDEELVLFVGNPSHAKGIDVLLAAAERVFPARPAARLACTFELAYRGRAARAEAIDEALRRSPIADRFRFFGLLARIAVLMRAADLAVFPFRSTSGPSDLPVALMECMAVGTPVIASDLAGNVELAGPDRAALLLVPAGDPSALAAALEALLGDERGRRALGEAGRRALATRYPLDGAVATLTSVYDALTARRASSGWGGCRGNHR